MATPASPVSLKEADSQYQAFNSIYNTALNISTPEFLYVSLNTLIKIRDDIEKLNLEIDKQNSLPDNIKTFNELDTNLNQKIHTISRKYLQSSQFSPGLFSLSSQYRVSPAFERLDDCVGYKNISNNCWLSALFQTCHQMSYLKTACERVGTFYRDEKIIDVIHMETVIQSFQGSASGVQQLENAIFSYNKIRKPIIRLKTIYRLMQNTYVTPALLYRFIIPSIYKNLIGIKTAALGKDLVHPTDEQVLLLIPKAINEILEDPVEGYDAKLRQLKISGEDLIAAITAYDNGVESGKAVPGYIAQHARIAFHHLFGDANRFSPKPGVSEDTLEGITALTTEYERILKLKKESFPASAYFLLETRRYYNPKALTGTLAGEGSLPLEKDSEGRLFSSEVHSDHQIYLTVPKNLGVSIEDLLKNNCLYNDTAEANYPVSETDRHMRK